MTSKIRVVGFWAAMSLLLGLALAYRHVSASSGPNVTQDDLVAPSGNSRDDLDTLIATYGESIPDEFHEPVPALPNSMAPDSAAVHSARLRFVAALERNGYGEKAVRVRKLFNLGLEDSTSLGSMRAVPLVSTTYPEFDAIIEQYGESVPDAYHPPLPAVPGTMAPDPKLLAESRVRFAASLERHGYTEKARRVSSIAVVGHPSDSNPDLLVPPAEGASPDSIDGLLSCDYTSSTLCNYSDVWVKVKGDFEFCIGLSCGCDDNVVGWVAPDVCIGDGQGGWEDVDFVWNCYGDLRVGSASRSVGSDAWHWTNGNTIYVWDDSGTGDVYLTGSGTTCWFCDWQGNCPSCCGS